MLTDLYCPHCLPPWKMLDARFEQSQGWITSVVHPDHRSIQVPYGYDSPGWLPRL
jgi:hypothetical protein